MNNVYNQEIQKIFDLDSKFDTGEISKEDLLNIILKADLFTLNKPDQGGVNESFVGTGSGDISNLKMMELINANEVYNRATTLCPNEELLNMRVSAEPNDTIERINVDFFKQISRLLPASGMNSAEDNIDPLTKVYTSYQEEH